MKGLNLLVWLTQLGISVAVPPVVFVLLGVWLRDRFALGNWVVVAAAAVGIICAALMFAVYAIIGKFHLSVVLGGLVGALLAVGNFFFMALIATLAADRAQQQDVEGGQKLIKGSWPIRLAVLAAVLFVCAKSGYFDVVALVLPLIFVRPVLTVREFFRKKGA